MNYGYRTSKIGQIQSFFQGSIATADNRDIFTFIKKSITGGANRYAITFVRLLRINFEPFGRSAGGNNNAFGIKEPEKIFNEGFTTKTSGSGLGLWICKKSVEEQNGELELTRSTEDYTEFTIKLGKEE